MLRRQLILIFCAGQLLAAAPWQETDSDLRLLAQVPPEGRCMQILLPPDLSDYKDVRARSESGDVLPATAIIVDGKMQAVSVNHSPSFRGGFASEYVEYEYDGELRKRRRWVPRTRPERQRPSAVYLYLLAEAAKSADVPALDDDDGEPEGLTPDSPVAFSLMKDTMVGRPATGREYRDLARRAERERPAHNGDWFTFADASDAGLSGFKISRSDNKQFMHLHLESNLVLPEARSLALTVDNGSRPSAWYLFVNHEPAASWTESAPGEQVALPKLDLPAGIHPISLFTIARANDSLPQLQLPEDVQLLTPHQPAGLILEKKKSVLTPGLSVAAEHRFAFDRTNTELGLFSIFDLSANLVEGKITRSQLRLGEHVAEFADGRAQVIVPLRTSQNLRLETADDHGYTATLDMPLRARIDGIKLLDADFDLVRLPTFLPPNGRLTFDYSLAWPEDFPQAFIDEALVDVRLYDSGGAMFANSAHSIPASPFKRQLALELPANAKSAVIALRIADQAIAPVQRIRFAEFADRDLTLSVSGERLRLGDHFAVLRPVTGAVPDMPEVDLHKVAIVDDFIATRNHISSELSVTAWLDAQELRSSHHPVVGSLVADMPHLAKFEKLGELLQSDADAIVWAVGSEELAHGMHLKPFVAEMRFVAAATLQAGKVPIMVSPPDTQRPYALALKELAVTYGVPIADLYSAALRSPQTAEHKSLDKAHSATLNAEGREWVLERILRAIRRAGS